MAIAKPELTDQVWETPVWPQTIPGADGLRPVYGPDADELVVLFEEDCGRDAYFDFIATPDVDYAAVKVDMISGQVIGVMVYPLAAWAVKLHAAWSGAVVPDPPPDAARRIVLDIKQLYDRYGLVAEADS